MLQIINILVKVRRMFQCLKKLSPLGNGVIIEDLASEWEGFNALKSFHPLVIKIILEKEYDKAGFNALKSFHPLVIMPG